MRITRSAFLRPAAMVGFAAGLAVIGFSPAPAIDLTPRASAAQPASAAVSELVGDRMIRSLPPGLDAAAALPSFALVAPLARTGEVPADWKLPVNWSKTDNGRWSAHVAIEPGTSLYGTGEIAGPLKRNGRTTVTWNTDAYGYQPDTASLYQSHPWVLGVRADGTAFGVLADTSWRTEINLTDGVRFTSEGPGFPVIVVERKTPEEVCTALAQLTGFMPLPPLWAIGYHQCRYSYNPESRVREVANEFRKRKIPCDVIWFDIDYMDGYRVFTFDKTQFPDPKGLNADLEKMGFSCIWMINPGVKAEPGFPIFDQVMAKDFAVKTVSGEVYRGAVWPGMCVFPDYTRDDVRAWWATLYKDFMANGIDGVWNDMNEPAIFNVASKTMPEDNQHAGGRWRAFPDTPEWTIPPGPHARFHNVYGMLMAQGTMEGIQAANPDKRPFVLTRAGFLGSHRYAATWTGDNSATWTDLEASVPMAINLGLSGQPFAGPDIGGFIGNGPGAPGDVETKGMFFARWMGVGALLPFSRGHTAKGNDNKEPWAYTPEVERLCRLALERRYRLLPFFYTLFREASVTGVPVIRPVFFADPTDPALRSEDDAFLLGRDLLVIPQLMPDKSRVAVEPKGVWRRIELVGEGLEPVLPELKIRAGSIIPCGPIVQHSKERPLDELELLVCLDADGRAVGRLYEDAGDGFGFRNGDFRLTEFSASTENGRVVVRSRVVEGQRPAVPGRRIQVRLIDDRGSTIAQGLDDGSPIEVVPQR